MLSRLRSILPLFAATALLAACGGSADGPASSSTDVDKLLEQTFTGEKNVESGKLDLKLAIDAQGGPQGGRFDLKLGGPFQTEDAKQLPKLDLEVAFTGAGQNLRGGVTTTGEKAFVAFDGQDYAVSDQVYRQLEAGYQEAQKKGAEQAGGKDQSLTQLGIDPRKWLTNARNAGEEKVGDADTIRITGGVDVPKLLDDVNTALAKAGSLGLNSTGQVPQKLTDEQRAQITDAVKGLEVQIFTGKEDKILRRMVVDLDVDAPQQKTKATLKLDFSLLELNEDQEFKAPADAKPFDELLGQFGGLGALGSGSGGSGSGSGGAANQQQLDKYTNCITQAGSDTAKAQECAKLLQG